MGFPGTTWSLLAHDPIVELTEAEDRLIVLYTSGTTGRPKGILHSHCGFPVKAAQDMCFGTDVGAGTRISLDHGHWLDDGPVAYLRNSDPRRNDRPL